MSVKDNGIKMALITMDLIMMDLILIDLITKQHVVFTFCALTQTMTSIPPSKRRKRSSALVEDDLDAAEAVTHAHITTTTKSGVTKTKTVLVPLVPIPEKGSTSAVNVDTNQSLDLGEFNQNTGHEDSSLPRYGKVRDLLGNKV